jgi:7-alpha-hydroxysteroid dehydrogenase
MLGGFGVARIAVETFLRQWGIENGSAGVRCAWVRSAGSSDAPGVVEALKLRAKESGRTLDAVLAEMVQSAALTILRHLIKIGRAPPGFDLSSLN